MLRAPCRILCACLYVCFGFFMLACLCECVICLMKNDLHACAYQHMSMAALFCIESVPTHYFVLNAQTDAQFRLAADSKVCLTHRNGLYVFACANAS